MLFFLYYAPTPLKFYIMYIDFLKSPVSILDIEITDSRLVVRGVREGSVADLQGWGVIPRVSGGIP